MTPRLLACLTGALLASALPLAACDTNLTGTVTSPSTRPSAPQSSHSGPTSATAAESGSPSPSQRAPSRAVRTPQPAHPSHLVPGGRAEHALPPPQTLVPGDTVDYFDPYVVGVDLLPLCDEVYARVEGVPHAGQGYVTTGNDTRTAAAIEVGIFVFPSTADARAAVGSLTAQAADSCGKGTKTTLSGEAGAATYQGVRHIVAGGAKGTMVRSRSNTDSDGLSLPRHNCDTIVRKRNVLVYVSYTTFHKADSIKGTIKVLRVVGGRLT
ncbi:MAG: sensor domain-containing protein [Streptomycetales bacterium]